MTAYNRLSTKDVPFSIVCTGPARIAVRATDNRSSSQIAGILTTSGSGVGIADASNYGLGKAGTADIGGYAIRLLRSEEHTSELQSLMRISYAVFCLKKKK